MYCKMVNRIFKMGIYRTLTFLVLLCSQIVLVKNKNCRQQYDNKKLKVKSVNWAFSPVHLFYLAKVESEIYKLMVEYRNLSTEKIEILDRFIKDYEESVESDDSSESDINKYEIEKAKIISSHPLMTYRMVRRFVYGLEQIKRNISVNLGKSLLEKIDGVSHSFKLPTRKDLEDVMDNLLRMQNVYELPAHDLMNGILAGRTFKVGLTLKQSYQIGKYAISQKLYTVAFDWIQNVITEIRTNPNATRQIGINLGQVLESMKRLVKKHNKLHDSITDCNYFRVSLNRFTAKINLKSSSQLLQTLRSANRENYDYNPTFAFSDICSGAIKSQKRSDLYCYLERSVHPVWTIGPLKIEIHSDNPLVYQIYNAIGETAMNYLKHVSISELERAEVVKGPDQSKISATRTASNAFLFERFHKSLLDLEKKIGSMIGLKVENVRTNGEYVELEASEAIQVAVYTFGGHYNEHNDEYGYKARGSRDLDLRIATFMFYLNDVEIGGHTAFSKLGISVPPIKGSALFWYDLRSNGEVDKRTKHGGCPVILGGKWIANKWIRNNANFQKRKCSLDRYE